MSINNEFNGYNKKDSFVNLDAPENRMNSKGIACLHVTSDIATPMLEIGASNNDVVIDSEIICNKDLRIVDLSSYYAFNETRFDSFLYLQIQSNINLDDRESGYLFPQCISQQCMENGCDGIAYASKYVDINVPREKTKELIMRYSITKNARQYHLVFIVFRIEQ